MEDLSPLRSPLAPGNVYQFKGYPTKVKIKALSFPGTAHDDGGIPGVAVKWLDNNSGSGWWPFQTEVDFWADIRFRNLVDPKHA